MRYFRFQRLAIGFLAVCAVLAASIPAQAKTCPTGRTKIVGGDLARISHWPGFAALRLYAAVRPVSGRFGG